jgi:hypothetical protein
VPRDFWGIKDLWEQKSTRSIEGPGTFGVYESWRPIKPLFFSYFPKFDSTNSHFGLITLPRVLSRTPLGPFGPNLQQRYGQLSTGQSYNWNKARSWPYTTFLCPSGAHDLAFSGPNFMHMIWSSRAPLEPARAPGPVTLSPPLWATGDKRTDVQTYGCMEGAVEVRGHHPLRSRSQCPNMACFNFYLISSNLAN